MKHGVKLLHLNGVMVAMQAQVHGCVGSVDFREDVEPYFPPVINDPDQTDFARCGEVGYEGGI